MSVAQATAALTTAELRPIVGAAVGSSLPVGQVLGTQPTAQALRGTTVRILTSAEAAPTCTHHHGDNTPTPDSHWSHFRGKLPTCQPGGPRPCPG